MLYKADTPRSRTQNICLLISISAVILKLMVKITSIFFSYRFLRIAWPDIFSLSDHFPTPNPRLLCFFNVMVAWLWVMFDVDVAHLGLLWITVVVSAFGNWVIPILGDPGADSGGEGKSKRMEKYGRKKSKERREELLGTRSYQTNSKRSPPFWLLVVARKLLCLSALSEARMAMLYIIYIIIVT